MLFSRAIAFDIQFDLLNFFVLLYALDIRNVRI